MKEGKYADPQTTKPVGFCVRSGGENSSFTFARSVLCYQRGQINEKPPLAAFQKHSG